MSISIKNVYAEEILEAMANTLGDKEFTSMYKTASEKEEECVEQDADPSDVSEIGEELGLDKSVVMPGDVQYRKEGDKVPHVKPETKLAPKKPLVPGVKSKVDPWGRQKGVEYKAEDCEECSDCADCDEAQDVPPEGPVGPGAEKALQHADDPKVEAAINFTLKHLTKIANALDNNGYSGLANMIDETIERLAAKKCDHTYSEWVKIFGKKSDKAKERFVKTFEKVLVQAKKDGKKSKEAKEYALKATLEKMPESYFKDVE
jgi:hypothetical protein